MEKLEEELLSIASGEDSPRWKSESDLAANSAAKAENEDKKSTSKSVSRSASLSNLKSANVSEGMRRHIAQLRTDLAKEHNLVKEVKREKVRDIRTTKDSEGEKYQKKLKVMELTLRKEFDKDMEREKGLSRTEFDKEMKRLIKHKDNELQFEKESWLRVKENLYKKVENARNDALQELSVEHEYKKKIYEKEIHCLKQDNSYLHDELKVLRESLRNRPNENIRIYNEHHMELEALKKQASQDSKKQLSEIKQLQNVIEQLEKKLGFEAGTCLRLQMEKDALDDALVRLKQADSWSRRSAKDVKGSDYRGVEFDLEGIIMELPQRLASKPHNDPERILHRKYIELCSLVRRLDEKNQVLGVRNEELLEELQSIRDDRKPLEEKVVQLGTKNMELSQAVRKQDSKIKDLQKDNNDKDDKIVHLQQLVEKKDLKLKKARKKDKYQVNVDDYDDLQRQVCQQLQVIAELRQQNIENDRRIDVLKSRHSSGRNVLQGSRRKSLSLDSLNGIVGLDATDAGIDDLPSEDAEVLFDDLKSSIDDHHENKRRFARLTKEHLELQQAYALLQRQSCEAKDPERTELQREALQSDLLVLQATINELERKLDDKESEQDSLLEQINTLKGDIDALEEKNEDFHQKLISAESDLVQKTLQLKGLTEEIKELMDQNDLMEFRMAELDDSPKLKRKSGTPLRLTEEDREDLTTDIDDVACDAISVRIALKELEINQQDELTPIEKKTLVQARALVDKGAKELLELQGSDRLLRERVEELEGKYNDAKQKLCYQDDELKRFRNEKLKLEEHELLNVENMNILGKRRKSSFDLTYGFEKTPADLLAEANSKICELEYLNEMLQNKMNRMSGANVDLSGDEIELLRQKMDRLRDAEKQINILKASNDDLFGRLSKFEDQTMTISKLSTSSRDDHLPKELADEISKLKLENETLNGELGNLRVRADDALALAQKTKEVLSKDDQATQTPSFELFDPIHRVQKSPSLEIPELDPEVIEQAVVEEMMTEFVVEDVECAPYEIFPDMMEQSSVSGESVSSYDQGDGEQLQIPDEDQLHSDNEFIQSIIREYDSSRTPSGDGKHNESVIYRPVEQLAPQPDLPSENEFDVYLNETLQLETRTSSDGALSNLSSNRSSTGPDARRLDPQSDSAKQTPRSAGDLDEGRWSTLNVGNEKPLLIDVNGRVSSDCSTCGLTPPCKQNIPQDIIDQLANYSEGRYVSSSISSNNATPRTEQDFRRDSVNSNYSHSSQATPRADSYTSACSTCGITPPHSARGALDSTRSQLSSAHGSAFSGTNGTHTEHGETTIPAQSFYPQASSPSKIPIRVTHPLTPSNRPSRPVYKQVTPESEHCYIQQPTRDVFNSYSVSSNELRSESASPPYNIPHKPPPYNVEDKHQDGETSKEPSVSNLPVISEDVLRAINKPSSERFGEDDVSDDQESDISLQGVDADIKELLNYGKHIKEFEREEIDVSEKETDEIPQYLLERGATDDLPKSRQRSYSEPSIRYSPALSKLGEAESRKSVKSISSSDDGNCSSPRQPSKFDGFDVHRLDSGIGSIPRGSEIDTTYDTSYLHGIPTDRCDVTTMDVSKRHERVSYNTNLSDRVNEEYSFRWQPNTVDKDHLCPSLWNVTAHKHRHSFKFAPENMSDDVKHQDPTNINIDDTLNLQEHPKVYQWSPTFSDKLDSEIQNANVFDPTKSRAYEQSLQKWRADTASPPSDTRPSLFTFQPANVPTFTPREPTFKHSFQWHADHIPKSVCTTELHSAKVYPTNFIDVSNRRRSPSDVARLCTQNPHRLQYGFDESLTIQQPRVNDSLSDIEHRRDDFHNPNEELLRRHEETADQHYIKNNVAKTLPEKPNAGCEQRNLLTTNKHIPSNDGLSYHHHELPRPFSADEGLRSYEFSRPDTQFNFSPTPFNDATMTALDKTVSNYKPNNYFSIFHSQENIFDDVNKRDKIHDGYTDMLRGRPKPPGRQQRSYSHSPVCSTRPTRSRSHSPLRNRYENWNVPSLRPKLESCRFKFPSDSELSRKSDQDSEFIRHVRKSDDECPRMLPKPIAREITSLEPKKRRPPPTLPKPTYSKYTKDGGRRKFTDEVRVCYEDGRNDYFGRMNVDGHAGLKKEITYLNQECESLQRQLRNKETVIREIQDELKEDTENIAMLEKKDKEIQLKVECITQLTQLLQKTRKELELKIVECSRRDVEIKQLKVEFRNVNNEKKKIEVSNSETQIAITKLETTETRLDHMTRKCDEVVEENRELIERIKTLEISEREFIDLERNVIDLQTQLRDMEDIEVHRDELLYKLTDVKKQRDDFLQKGRLVEEERNEFVRSNKTLEQYIIEWKKKTSEFKKTNQALKDRIIILERDKKDLENRVVEVQQERTTILTKIHKIEMERDDYIRELTEITMERNTLEARLADLEDLLGDHDQLEEGFHSLRLKVSELTRQRDDAEMFIQSYKAKVQVLKKTIVEKEETIMQLSHQLETIKIQIGSSSIEDISRMKADFINLTTKHHHHHGSDRVKNYFHDKEPDLKPLKYYRPSDDTSESDSYDPLPVRPGRYDTYSDDSYIDDKFTRKHRDKHRNSKKYVAMFDYDPYKSSTSTHPERELRMREGDYITVYGEMDIDGYMEGEIDGVHGLVPSIYVEELSDDGRDMSRSHHNHYSVKDSRDISGRRFVVLYDYDPYTMGTTDRPDLQLSLRKGDVITVFGDIDVDGYFTATFNGRRGLVPSNFVEEYSSYYHSSRGHSSSHHQHGNGNFQGTIEVDQVAGPPFAPRDLKVSRVVTKTAVLLSWQLPGMDEYGLSNGCRIKGYRLWVNGKVKQDVSSATTTKALIDDVDLQGRVEFSIQSIGENDLCSEKCHFAITGALTALSNDGSGGSGSNSYVALYDYDPFKSSPNPNPSLELAFREGDLMTVYDTSRSDGFYGAEMNGKKGLVPSNFIEQVSGGGSSSSHRHHSSSHHTSSHHHHDSDSNRRVSFKKKE